jgi:hypothetical protein
MKYENDNTVIQAAGVSIFAAWAFNYTFVGVIFLTSFLCLLQYAFNNRD